MRDFVVEESAVTALEYGLIAAIIVVGCLAAMTSVGDAVANNIWTIIAAISDLI